MYYVETETDDYHITTSYATYSQATKYGGLSIAAELHLQSDGISRHVHELDPDLIDLGRVRTIYTSRMDGSKAGRFMLYIKDGEDLWMYTGISFQEYKDANKFLKLKAMTSFGEMLIVENPAVSQAMDSRGTSFSTDSTSPKTRTKLCDLTIHNIYDELSPLF